MRHDIDATALSLNDIRDDAVSKSLVGDGRGLNMHGLVHVLWGLHPTPVWGAAYDGLGGMMDWSHGGFEACTAIHPLSFEACTRRPHDRGKNTKHSSPVHSSPLPSLPSSTVSA